MSGTYVFCGASSGVPYAKKYVGNLPVCKSACGEPPAKRMTGLFYPRSASLGLSGPMYVCMYLALSGPFWASASQPASQLPSQPERLREAQRDPERLREAQRSPERPSPEKPRDAQRGPDRLREAQRGPERPREAQKGPERPR